MHQVDNPIHADTVIALQQLRQKTIEALPAKLRAKYEKAVESDWYARYSNGQDVELLSKNETENSILYALLDDDEFLTQGWTDREFKKFLSSVKAEGKLTGWQKLKNIFKSFLGMSKVKEGSIDEHWQ
jgi:S-adenosylmethionine:diacylglycerol 3-amino-3-carboxypropyl transferase